jgi:hypothetical protein
MRLCALLSVRHLVAGEYRRDPVPLAAVALRDGSSESITVADMNGNRTSNAR